MNMLVGHTGFVGSNLYQNGKFDRGFNSKNLSEAFGTNPELLVFSGLRAEKYLANNEPEKDLLLIKEAEQNIKKINPKRIVLISTIDVFKNPINVDENSKIYTNQLEPYGKNRYELECYIIENFSNALIIRLPALFGINIKKNFIYDYINIVPFMLKENKFLELSEKEPLLKNYYYKQENGFYKLNANGDDRSLLKKAFIKLNFTALNFTDSRAKFQFYNLKNLYNDMNIALEKNIKFFHPATEPISAGELYYYLTGNEFINELNNQPQNYDYRTIHYKLFNGNNGYIKTKEDVMREIKNFIEEQ